MAPARNTRHSFRLPSLHRLNTKDISTPAANKTTTATGPYHPLATPPLPKTPPPPNTHHTHHAGPSSTDICCTSPDSGSNPTLSPSSTVSTSASPSSFGVPYASTADPQHQHYQLPHGSGVAASSTYASCGEPTPAKAAASLAQSPPSAALPHANSNTNASTASGPSHSHPQPPINTNNNRIRHLLQLRRKHSRIDIEREMAEERERYGGGSRRCSADYGDGNGADGTGAGRSGRAPGGMLDVLEPRPRPGPGVRGSGGIGGIFEVLDG